MDPKSGACFDVIAALLCWFIAIASVSRAVEVQPPDAGIIVHLRGPVSSPIELEIRDRQDGAFRRVHDATAIDLVGVGGVELRIVEPELAQFLDRLRKLHGIKPKVIVQDR